MAMKVNEKEKPIEMNCLEMAKRLLSILLFLNRYVFIKL